jgi:lysophospholipase L1-like esterase
MRELELSALPLVGALSTDRTAAGLVPARLPAWAREQLLDREYAYVVKTAAGVRIELATDARELELDVVMTLVVVAGEALRPAAFDLVVDGQLVETVETSEGIRAEVAVPSLAVTLRPGRQATLRFERLPGDMRARTEVWLPHTAAIELRGWRVSDGATARAAPARPLRWLHHGSSISHCVEAPTPTAAWPVQVALRAGWDLQNLGFAANCHLDQHVARALRDEPADLITLKAGINIVGGDTMRERTFTSALHGFLDTVRDGHPTTPLVVVTPILCPFAEDAPGPAVKDPDGRFRALERPASLGQGSLSLRRVRELVSRIVEARRAAGDAHLHLLDGLELFGWADVEHLPDDLHPSPEGYTLLGERFLARLRDIDEVPAGA